MEGDLLLNGIDQREAEHCLENPAAASASISSTYVHEITDAITTRMVGGGLGSERCSHSIGYNSLDNDC